MKLKSLFIIFTIFMFNTVVGQSLDEYKYIIIPAKYEFQKTDDQYQLNALTKFLFEKEGFITQFDNVEMPLEISKNPCDVLTARVNNTSNMFTTKMVIELINCKNQKVLISEEGRSKEKEYKKGYQEALRNAFKSVTAQNYNGTNTANLQLALSNNEVQNAKNAVMESNVNAVELAQEVNIIETTEVEIPDEIEITEVEEDMDVVEDTKEEAEEPSNMLYAQSNSLGYQLVDSTPKVVYILLNSSKKDVFLLKDKSGMIYKENGIWFAEYYDQDALLKKPLNIKF